MRKHRTGRDLCETSTPVVMIKPVLSARTGSDKEVQQSVIIVVSPSRRRSLASDPFVHSYGIGQDTCEPAVPVIMIETIKRVRGRANDEQVHETVVVII